MEGDAVEAFPKNTTFPDVTRLSKGFFSCIPIFPLGNIISSGDWILFSGKSECPVKTPLLSRRRH